MSGTPSIVFVLDQLQDVNVARGLVHLAAREFDAAILLLASDRFFARDRTAAWCGEISALAAEMGAEVLMFAGPADLERAYRDRRGVVVASAESDLSPHRAAHMALAHAPASFLRVTLQHGHECPGFLQNREHVIAHGEAIAFAADVLCAWAPPALLASLAAPERAKVFVTGPSVLLQRRDPSPEHPPVVGGLVCENLHSARLTASGDHGTPFLAAFEGFATALRREGRGVTLRPHPGGQYVVRNRTPIPRNVMLNNLPIYRVDLSRYAYGISAPSTVLLDMALAGVPVAVWRDPGGVMDVSAYRGLPLVSGTEEWLAFARDARVHRSALLAAQGAWLDGLGILRDPAEVYRRFARLFAAALASGSARPRRPSESLLESGGARPWPLARTVALPPRRVLLIANDLPLPTLEISFERPLAVLVEAGAMTTISLEERDLKAIARGRPAREGSAVPPPSPSAPEPGGSAARRIEAALARIAPDVIVFCRYGGAHADAVVAAARAQARPVVFHIDDDLLTIPRVLGLRKYVNHNLPGRRRTLRHLLGHADLVYASTTPLMERLARLGVARPMVAGPLMCAGEVIAPAEPRPVTTVGYMGFDHAHDLEMILPGLVAFLERNEGVAFELFGRIPIPAALERFGARVRRLPPVRGYGAFLKAFAERRWDIGICPLQPTSFNRLKANGKWVEYTAVGAAVVASADMIYDACCADGCGILVRGADGWGEALESLARDPEARFHMVRRAQRRLVAEYGLQRLRRQVLEVFAEASAIAGANRASGSENRARLRRART